MTDTPEMIDLAAHTPGPWRWVEAVYHKDGWCETPFGSGCCPGLIGANDEPVFSGSGTHYHDASLDIPEANARLIAAAPDMLEALRAVDQLWGKDAAMGFEDEMKLNSPVGKVWAVVRAALARIH